MAESKTKNQTKATTNQTRVAGKASAQRKPADQALQVVDVAVGAVPEAADAVTKTVDQMRDAEARGGDIRRQVTDQVVEQARKARERVEPLYTDRVPSAVKQRVEPAVKRVTGNRETARV